MAAAPRPQLDIPELDPAVQFFCEKGIADSTHKTYKSALRRFGAFCSLYDILSPFPVSEALLCYFAAAMAKEGLTPQTIKTYLAAIRHMQITLGLPEPREFSSLPRLRLVQSGIKRTHSQRVPRDPKVRLPITPTILHQIRAQWLRSAQDPDIIMLWAAACLCFFRFFRSGEITIPSLSAFDPKVHLSWGDIAVDNPAEPSALQVTLKRSKCDQFGEGVRVLVGRTGDAICPVAAMLAYLASRGCGEGPLFFFANKHPLTKAKFTENIRKVLQEIGLPYHEFAGHSFRIGAATAASRAGLEDSTIRMLGRWNSSAFLLYIRTPRESLVQFSRSIANA